MYVYLMKHLILLSVLTETTYIKEYVGFKIPPTFQKNLFSPSSRSSSLSYFDAEVGGDVLRKGRMSFARLHGGISQKQETFKFY
jgi:hypothetical protein